MNVSILTVFPEIIQPFLQTSLLKKASEKGLVTFDVASYFSFAQPQERIDAPTFGPGSGMLLKPTIVEKAIAAKEAEHGKAFKIFFSPQGQKLNQKLLQQLSEKILSQQHILLACARYEGMDARVEQEYADLTVSIGDYVVMGGDLPAMIFLEGLLRYLPGVIGRAESVEHDSFSGPFVDYPEYTEPVVWHEQTVPEIVRSGNHAAIEKWRATQAAQKTITSHFEWFKSSPMTEKEKNFGAPFIPPHYAVLMHSDVIIKDQGEKKEGTTSVTSLDIHDIARSARTYGLKEYFLVTKLVDQQKVVERLLHFWKTDVGSEYNPERFEAVKHTHLASSIDEVIQAIEAREGKRPLLIATSARATEHQQLITYYDQEKVWTLQRPVLLVFGTGRGLSEQLLKKCDFLLVPVSGFSEFNHLSVRSAAAVIFDRWLGWNPKNLQ
jgi:tRNA (guanine37-N1)-methyltransferase